MTDKDYGKPSSSVTDSAVRPGKKHISPGASILPVCGNGEPTA
jgi:hypothetical protein